MPVHFVDFEAARERSGLRMIVVPGVPSPWGEAAKGILHLKELDYVAVRHDPRDEAMAGWAGGHRSGPVLFIDDEPPRHGWAEILHACERLAPTPPLLPAEGEARALALGLAAEICGEMGLGWCRRNVNVHSALQGGDGFPKPVAAYLAPKYGYREEDAARYTERTIEILRLLAGRLHAQQAQGSPWYFDRFSATDVYSATFMALFAPLPDEHCPMPAPLRLGFSAMEEGMRAALDPILLAHRDRVYTDHLELPLTLA